MLKKLILVFFILIVVVLKCGAVDWSSPVIGEYPFNGNSDMIIPITDDVRNLSDKEKLEHLKKIYHNEYINLVKNGYVFYVREINKENYLYYDKDLNIFATIKNGKIKILSPFISKEARFVGICDADMRKCGLYDAKKNLFTGLEYENISDDTFSGTPILIKNGKKIYLQPFRNVGLSFLIVTSWVVSVPFIIILSPFIFMLI